MRTLEELIQEATDTVLSTYQTQNIIPEDKVIKEKIYTRITISVVQENMIRKTNAFSTLRIPQNISNAAISMVLNFKYVFHRISLSANTSTGEYTPLIVYNNDTGLYEIIPFVSNGPIYEIYKMAKPFNNDLTERDSREIYNSLQSMVDVVFENRDENLIPVENGVFNFEKKQLEDFSPDRIFIRKLATSYVANAVPVYISQPDGTKWDVESWINELSDDPEVRTALWQVIASIVRPYHPRSKAVFFYAPLGNNGKGTFCAMLRALVGDYNVSSYTIHDFANRYFDDHFERSIAVIADEVDMNQYATDVSKFKAAVTGDPFMIEKKYQHPTMAVYRGLIIQCMNGNVRTADRTGSFYRRQLYLPFDKCFTGHENTLIKSEYVKRPDVLEYLLYKVLNMDFHGIDEPAVSKEMVDEYKRENDPIMCFLDEMIPKFVNDLIPLENLYILYKAWHVQYNASGSLFSYRGFNQEIREKIINYPGWKCTKSNSPISTGKRINRWEPVYSEYGFWQGCKVIKTGAVSYQGIYR